MILEEQLLLQSSQCFELQLSATVFGLKPTDEMKLKVTEQISESSVSLLKMISSASISCLEFPSKSHQND